MFVEVGVGVYILHQAGTFRTAIASPKFFAMNTIICTEIIKAI
jgi:hypothetical protein